MKIKQFIGKILATVVVLLVVSNFSILSIEYANIFLSKKLVEESTHFVIENKDTEGTDVTDLSWEKESFREKLLISEFISTAELFYDLHEACVYVTSQRLEYTTNYLFRKGVPLWIFNRAIIL